MSFIRFLCSNLLDKLEVITLSGCARYKERTLTLGRNHTWRSLLCPNIRATGSLKKSSCLSEHLLGNVAFASPSKKCIEQQVVVGAFWLCCQTCILLCWRKQPAFLCHLVWIFVSLLVWRFKVFSALSRNTTLARCSGLLEVNDKKI